MKEKPRLEKWKGKALKTGKRVEKQNWGVVDSADMTVEPKKLESGKDGKPSGVLYRLTRTIVDHVEVYAFEKKCTCGKGTPQPDQETLRRSFDSGSCWIHSFTDWHPKGWMEAWDGHKHRYVCPECVEKTFWSTRWPPKSETSL